MEDFLTIVIPAYNEASNLQNLVPQWIKFCSDNNYKLIIIDDGSTDGSKEILENYNQVSCLKVIQHKVNKGYGAAIKTGIEEADTKFVITLDADGQHRLSDINELINVLIKSDADMVIGSREQMQNGGLYRKTGKWIIREFANLLLSIPIYDLNSGMKLYRRDLVQKYINICPDSMAFSDTITLIFINRGHLVLEHPITVDERKVGKSTINFLTAFDTIWKILIIAMLFKPMKIFLPLSLTLIISGTAWEIPIFLHGSGVSVGASLSILSGIIFFFFGLLAEQLSLIIKSRL